MSFHPVGHHWMCSFHLKAGAPGHPATPSLHSLAAAWPSVVGQPPPVAEAPAGRAHPATFPQPLSPLPPRHGRLPRRHLRRAHLPRWEVSSPPGPARPRPAPGAGGRAAVERGRRGAAPGGAGLGRGAQRRPRPGSAGAAEARGGAGGGEGGPAGPGRRARSAGRRARSAGLRPRLGEGLVCLLTTPHRHQEKLSLQLPLAAVKCDCGQLSFIRVGSQPEVLEFGLKVKPVLEGLTGQTQQQALGEVVERAEVAHLQAHPAVEEGCPAPNLRSFSAVINRRSNPKKRRNKSHNFIRSEHRLNWADVSSRGSPGPASAAALIPPDLSSSSSAHPVPHIPGPFSPISLHCPVQPRYSSTQSLLLPGIRTWCYSLKPKVVPCRGRNLRSSTGEVQILPLCREREVGECAEHSK
ncbi:uncharacterized protein LOC120323184 [Pipra filicauda]|uniref:Uncharacterized protein LOC120323184 n=1 Tax=Pipra filicauda TaxID=649802 RepID=A0A7R5KGU7_9PASS|nr:uncharacterized protein LOC120323184 [Pipra filicauda]